MVDQESALSVRANMLWNSLGSLIGLGCQWLITVLIVRLADGYSDAGVYALAVSVFGIFSPIAQYRMYTYQISDVKGENTVGEYMMFRFLTSAISMALLVPYAILTCSRDSWLAILLYSVYKILTLVIDVFHACDQRHARMDYIGKSLMLQGAGSLLVFVVSYLLVHSLEITLISMCVLIVGILFVFDYPRVEKLEHVSLRLSNTKALYLLRTCFPVVLAGIAASAMPSIPRQYLAWSLGSDALGIYASVAAPVAIIQMGASYVYNPLLSYFAQYHYDAQIKHLRSALLKASILILMIGLLCCLLISAFGEELLSLCFGDSIRAYAYLLFPLLMLALLTGFLWFMNDLLIAFREFRGTFISSVVSLLISCATVVPCVQWFGMNGVTAACIIATLSGIAIMCCYIKKFLVISE